MSQRVGKTAGGLARDFGRWLVLIGRTYLHVWITALLAPWLCFRTYVLDRDQTRAIGFAAVVTVVWLLAGVLAGTVSYPVLGGMPAASLLLWLVLLSLVAVPIGIHLLSFVATLILVATVSERAPVSATVQVVAFAMAPAVFLSIPVVEVQAIVGVYGALLLIYGLRVVHETSFWRALLAGAIPAYLLYALGFGADAALYEVLRAFTII